ncbi:MAG: NUDIX domain-containing protein [Actinomycetota bacterium]|nr:NUDIX domain-containing protein [Actinomycetota bacterium]
MLAIGDFDATKQQRFWVPVAGRVEFGETGRQAIIREVRRELDAETLDLGLLRVLESLFTFEGGGGHEIVFVNDTRVAATAMYDAEFVTGMEGDKQFVAHWIDRTQLPTVDRSTPKVCSA